MSIIYNRETRTHHLRKVDIREGEIIDSKIVEAGRIIKYNNNTNIVIGDDVIFEKDINFKHGERTLSLNTIMERLHAVEDFVSKLSEGLVVGRYKEDGTFEEYNFNLPP